MNKSLFVLKEIFNRRASSSENALFVNGFSHSEGEAGAYYTIIENEVSSQLTIRPGMQLLDIGCGNGELMARYQMKGLQVQGLDISDRMVAQVVQRGLNAVSYDGMRFPMADNQFDLAICVGVIHNIDSDDIIQGMIQEAIRVTKPGGQILITNIPGPYARRFRRRKDLFFKLKVWYLRNIKQQDYIPCFRFSYTTFTDFFVLPKVGAIKFYKHSTPLPGYENKMMVLFQLNGQLD